jgi:hypothetical protein
VRIEHIIPLQTAPSSDEQGDIQEVYVLKEGQLFQPATSSDNEGDLLHAAEALL